MSRSADGLNPRPMILFTEPSDPVPLRWLKERAEVIESSEAREEFWEHLSRADGLVVRTYTKVNAAFLDLASRLRVVGRGGVGIENIDVKECRRRGIEVVYTPDANTLAVGDFVFGLIIRLVRDWPMIGDKALAPADFKRVRNAARGRQLNEMTLGILGMGRVGRRVGHIAVNGFGMRVIYNDIVDVKSLLDFPAEAVEKDRLYRECDILSVHVDMRKGNENLVGAKEIGMMKKGAILLNTSRGEVLEINAVAGALKAGRLSAAAIDVYAPEPPGEDFPLLGMKNVILTPHLASRTNTAVENMSWVVRDVLAVLQGQKPKFPAPEK